MEWVNLATSLKLDFTAFNVRWAIPLAPVDITSILEKSHGLQFTCRRTLLQTAMGSHKDWEKTPGWKLTGLLLVILDQPFSIWYPGVRGFSYKWLQNSKNNTHLEDPNLEKNDVQIFTSFKDRLMVFLRAMQFLILLKCWHFKASREEQTLDSFQVWEKSREIPKGLSCALL